MFNKEELEIMKAALAGDIIYQEGVLEKLKPEQKREFKNWLLDTKDLYKKVSKQLFEIKANE